MRSRWPTRSCSLVGEAPQDLSKSSRSWWWFYIYYYHYYVYTQLVSVYTDSISPIHVTLKRLSLSSLKGVIIITITDRVRERIPLRDWLLTMCMHLGKKPRREFLRRSLESIESFLVENNYTVCDSTTPCTFVDVGHTMQSPEHSIHAIYACNSIRAVPQVKSFCLFQYKVG